MVIMSFQDTDEGLAYVILVVGTSISSATVWAR